MAFTLIAHAGASGNGTTAVTAGIDTSGADLIVLVINYYASGSHSIADSKSNGAPSALTAKEDTGVIGTQILYWLNPTVGSGHTFTLNDLYARIQVAAFSGAHASSPFDQQNGAIGSGSPLSTGSITPGEDNELVIAGFGALLKDYASVDSGFTTLDSAAYVSGIAMSGALAYKIQTTAAAVNPAFTSSSGAYAAAAIASFKSAASGSAIKTINGLARASIKTINGLAIASVKTFNGLA